MVEMRPSVNSSQKSSKIHIAGSVDVDAASNVILSEAHKNAKIAPISDNNAHENANGENSIDFPLQVDKAREELDARWAQQQARLRQLLNGNAKQTITNGKNAIFGVDDGSVEQDLLRRSSSSSSSSRSATLSTTSTTSTTTSSTSTSTISSTSRSTTRPQNFLSHVQFEHSLLQHFVPLPVSQFVAQIKANPPRQLLVLSPGDSGQSMVARLLMMMGFYGGQMSEFYLQGADPNPKERWERKDVYKLNQLLLAAHQFDVDTYETAIGFALSSVSPANRSFFLSRLRRLLKQLAAHSDRWVINEPRASLLARLYIGEMTAPLCVHVFRDPLSFAKASQRRRFSSWGMFEWLAVWEKYTIAALQACAGVPSVVVRHDELVRNPVATIARLRADLAALGVRTDAPMSDAELRAWVPRPDAWIDRFFNEFQIVSESQTSLAAAFASGGVARWGLASTAAAREFATADIVLPAERAILSGSTETHGSHLAEPPMLPLHEVLPRVAIPSVDGKSQDIVAVYANSAFVEMVKNFECNLGTLELDHVLFALDSELCREVRVLNAPCYFDSKFGSGVGEIQFWTIAANSSYVQLMMMKMHYVNEVLRNNYNILLIDSDVVLMEDVRQHITANYATYDLVLQSDARIDMNDTHSWVCAGFFYMKASPRTRAFMDEVERVMRVSGSNDQDAMQLLLTGHGQKFEYAPDLKYKRAAEFGVTWVVLDWIEYPNGNTMFDLDLPAKRGVRPRIAHANMRPLMRKQKDLRRHNIYFLNDDADGCIVNTPQELSEKQEE
jgi:hypothetical protein